MNSTATRVFLFHARPYFSFTLATSSTCATYATVVSYFVQGNGQDSFPSDSLRCSYFSGS